MDFWHSRPRAVQGGIRSQTDLKGANWWSRRWIALLESLYLGGRLDRGRRYAKTGQVLSIEVEPGRVDAQVQGSGYKPYQVHIGVQQLDPESIVQVLSTQPGLAARLLAGTLPENLEGAFAEQGLSLFPNCLQDLTTRCSCPDATNPCKHLAAVFYLLAEEFDRDPFLLLRLRGAPDQIELQEEVADALEPLQAENFWQVKLPADAPLGPLPSQPAPLLRQLGNFPMWRGQQKFQEAMEPLYLAASARAQRLLEGGD